MPIGIVESALVIAAVSGTYSVAKKRRQRVRRRNFFRDQRSSALENVTVKDVVPVEESASTIIVTDMPTMVSNKLDLPADAETDKSALEKIWGIGPIYVERLNGAGIHTYEQLANQSAEQLVAIVTTSDGAPRPDVETWITQASELATQ